MPAEVCIYNQPLMQQQCNSHEIMVQSNQKDFTSAANHTPICQHQASHSAHCAAAQFCIKWCHYLHFENTTSKQKSDSINWCVFIWIHAKFHPNTFWKHGALGIFAIMKVWWQHLGLLKRSPDKKKNNNNKDEMSSDMNSVPHLKNICNYFLCNPTDRQTIDAETTQDHSLKYTLLAQWQQHHCTV